MAALFAAIALATFATYARHDAEDLYHVSESGVAGGAGRVLVFLNYPTALVAVAIAGLAADRLLPRRPVLVTAAAVLAAVLSLVMVVPGVVDQDDLDAKPINAVPALGVGIAVALLVWAIRRRGSERVDRAYGDRLRVVLGALLVVVSVPWIFAELGFYAPDPIFADERPPGEDLAAVHLGRHHGMDGVLLALTALALSRPLHLVRHARIARVLSPYVALMLAYGLANAFEDGFNEQITKRGWTDWKPSSVLRPELSPEWAAIVVGAVAVEVLWFRRARARGPGQRSKSDSHSDIGT